MTVGVVPAGAQSAPDPYAIPDPYGVPAPVAPGAPAPARPADPGADAWSAGPPPSAAEYERMRREAFEETLRNAFPATTDQITEYRRRLEEQQRAVVEPVSPGRPVSRSVRLTLRPGEVQPSVRVEPGTVSTVTFSDATGQPWPIMSVVTGNPQAYAAQSAGAPGNSNILVVSALQPWVPSNLVVTLYGHPVPIAMVLEQGAHETDYRLDVQVAASGPNAAPDLTGTPTSVTTDDHVRMQFLDGTYPDGARRLHTSSSDVEAFEYAGVTYVRTRADLVTPPADGKASNVSGTNVYSLADDWPILMVSSDGRLTSVRIER